MHAHSKLTHHVTFGGVDTISQAFDRDPFDGHLWDPALPVVVSVVDLLGEAEVSNTHVHVLVQPEAKRPTCYRAVYGKGASGFEHSLLVSFEFSVRSASTIASRVKAERKRASGNKELREWKVEAEIALTCSCEQRGLCGWSSCCWGTPSLGQYRS